MFLSLTGISSYIKRKSGITDFFLPLVTVAIITIIMFISGLLNVLSLMPYVLLFAGLALLFIHIRAVYRKEEAPVYRQPGYLIFLLLCLFFIFILKGQYYIQYDDFSHWGTVLKEMFYYNTFPDSRSIITFRNYPPGTASFLYFVCKIIGYNESYALMAQAFLCAATFPALFCGCKKIFEAKTFLWFCPSSHRLIR